MKPYAQLIGATNGVHHLTASNGNTKDIMNTVLLADSKSDAYCKQLAQTLAVPNDPVQTCYNIWNFWKQNVKYVEDPDGYQFVKSPAYMYEVGDTQGADCKSLSVGVACCLKQLGIPYAYRFITQEAAQPFHHVYVVAYTKAGQVLIDCVIDYFNKENPYARKKDVAPTTPQPQRAAIGKTGVHYIPNHIGAKLDVGHGESTQVNTPNGKIDVGPANPNGYWSDIVTDYKLNYHTKKARILDHILFDLKNQWMPAHPIKFSMFYDAVRKHYTEWQRLAYTMGYHFWDDADVPLPAQLAEKRNFGYQLYTELKTIGFRDATLRAMCDIGTYDLMGIPLDYAIYRAKCITKWGQPWEPVVGVPYWNAKTGTLIENGGGLDKAFQLAACMPYLGSDKVQAISKPDGLPYWCIGGWIMRNGASDATVAAYLKANPNRPPINLQNKPTPAQINAAIATYQKWLNGNLAGLPTILGGKYDQKLNVVSGSKIGEPITATVGTAGIVAIVVACVTAAATVAGIVANIVQSATKAKQGGANVIPDFKSDFHEVYQTVDGCIMYQSNSTGALKKCCPNGQCTDNPNPNDPANQPGAGNFGAGGSSKWLWLAGAALAMVFLFSGSSSSKS